MDLTGVSCLVLGDEKGLGDDLAVYLRYSGATVERVTDLAAARRTDRKYFRPAYGC